MNQSDDITRALNRRIAREQAARNEAERLLEEKSLELYEVNEALKESLQNLKNTQSQLIHVSKLEALGTLAGGIAHEINTPIQFIGDNLNFLSSAFGNLKKLMQIYQQTRSMLPPEASIVVKKYETELDHDFLIKEIPEAIRQSLVGSNQVRNIVLAMRSYSHGNNNEKLLSDINEIIHSAVTLSKNEWKHFAEIEFDLDPYLPKVLCFPGEMNQVILNLIINAAQAISENDKKKLGRIKVNTKSYNGDILIEVIDNGPGIPVKIRNRIFDPFFTTKDVGKGSGQGLTIVHSIITEMHKAKISFETEENVGTTFRVQLPITCE